MIFEKINEFYEDIKEFLITKKSIDENESNN